MAQSEQPSPNFGNQLLNKAQTTTYIHLANSYTSPNLPLVFHFHKSSYFQTPPYRQN